MTLWLTLSLARAECASTESLLDLVSRLDRAEAAYLELEIETFNKESAGLAESVGCLTEPLTPSIVAKLHRIQGIAAFAKNDPEGAAGAFAAARSIEPYHTFSGLQAGHPMMVRYQAIDPTQVERTRVPRARTGKLMLDASAELDRAEGLPVTAQYFDAVGVVSQSAYLMPGEPMIDYPAELPPRPILKPLAISTAGAAGATAVTAGLFAISMSAYNNIDQTTAGGQDLLPGARSRTNALLLTSAGAAAVTIGLGGTTLALIRW